MAGFPLLPNQVDSISKYFKAKNECVLIGKIRRYEDGSEEFVAERSGRRLDISPTPGIGFVREVGVFDDERRSYKALSEVGQPYTTCLSGD